jgi:hypothetical protein
VQVEQGGKGALGAFRVSRAKVPQIFARFLFRVWR